MADDKRAYTHRPIVGIGVVVLRPGAVLLVRRGRAPARGAWSLPGGAQIVGETAEDAGRRELLEETGLVVGALTLVGNADSIHRDDTGRVIYHYTILDFCAVYAGGEAVAGDDASAVTWVEAGRLAAFHVSSDVMRIVTLARGMLRL